MPFKIDSEVFEAVGRIIASAHFDLEVGKPWMCEVEGISYIERVMNNFYDVFFVKFLNDDEVFVVISHDGNLCFAESEVVSAIGWNISENVSVPEKIFLTMLKEGTSVSEVCIEASETLFGGREVTLEPLSHNVYGVCVDHIFVSYVAWSSFGPDYVATPVAYTKTIWKATK